MGKIEKCGDCLRIDTCELVLDKTNCPSYVGGRAENAGFLCSQALCKQNEAILQAEIDKLKTMKEVSDEGYRKLAEENVRLKKELVTNDAPDMTEGTKDENKNKNKRNH